jgi:UPF0755 protein
MFVKFGAFLIVLIFVTILYYFAPTGFSDEKIRFVVPLEEKQEVTVNKIKEAGFIRSTRAFNFLAGLVKFPGTIEPGAYQLSHRMTLIDITITMITKPYQKWIVLVPGLRVEQVAERLAKKFNWTDNQSKEFLDNAREGMMFPDTYLFNVDFTPKEVAQRMISNFNEKFDAQMYKDMTAQNVRLITEVRIASLIERESGGDEDKALIAGIIWNRLNQNMRLQIDATDQYVKGTPADWWPHVTPEDLKVDSPYNTYLYKGLPPTPIASPGLSSLKAAVYPAETDCLFYLHDRNKQIHCAVTYEEHLENIANYLQ